MAKTIAIQIGNSDDKLTQKEWSEFVYTVNRFLNNAAKAVHFFGCSDGSAPWQNAACIFVTEDTSLEYIKEQLIEIRKHFNQDSIAWSECEVEFI